MLSDKRDEYLRGIAAGAPERYVDANMVRHAILQAAFDAIQDRTDWKNPINALVTIGKDDAIGLGVYIEAVKHFTSTEPNIYLADGFNAGSGKATYRIVSEGYRLGPAGDH